ncbi:MAG: DNA internalization-related competence protein ComEC/Rec2 [Slackia sp.]|nr:DNA internalization-related competence protein ComEC/Rec2 [Slackia sp.]
MGLLDEGLLDGRRKLEHGTSSCPMRPLPSIAFFCAVLLWIVAACWFFLSYDENEALPDGLDAGVWTFELLEDASKGDYGYSAPARAWHDGVSFNVRVLYDAADRLMAHECFSAYAVFDSFSESSRFRLAQRGLVADARVKGGLERVPSGMLAPLIGLRTWASGLFDGAQTGGAALMRALLTGDRVDIERDGLYDDMKAVGLAHMVAVSGSHLSVVASMAGFLMRRARVPRRLCAVVLCVFYAAYAVFTGLSAPVIRAAIMSAVVVSAVWARRRASALAALSVCVCVLIGLNPHNAVSLSFFLSAASTFGVIVFAPLFTCWAVRMTGGRCAGACEAFALTFAACFAIMPATVAVFSRFSCIAPVANMLAAPVFTLLLGWGLVALPVCALVPALGSAGLNAANAIAQLFCFGAKAAAHLPYSSVPVTGSLPVAGLLTAAAVVVLWVWWPSPSGKAMRVCCAGVVALAGVALAFAPMAANDEVVMLDVGQGDAILVKSQGASLLVDTGNQEQKLLSALARNKTASLDAVAVTHHDDDHCGCLELLAPTVRGSVLLSRETFSCGCDDCEELVEMAQRTVGPNRVRGMRCGDVVQVGRFTCKTIWPLSFEEEGGNADSLCFVVEYDAQGDGEVESSVLLTGDAEAPQIRAMMDEAGLKEVDVLKAGHHGSKAGVDEGFSQRVGSKAALISAGANNRYGHPSEEALEEFALGGMEVFRTDEQGDVTCRFAGDEIVISTQR